MKHYYKLILAMGLVFGDTSAICFAKDMNAEKVLATACAAIDQNPSITIDFNVRSNGQPMAGRLTMSGECFTMESNEATSWYDGKNLWVYSASSSEVNLSEPTKDELSEINPLWFIKSLNADYDKRLLKASNASENVVELTEHTSNKKPKTGDKIIAYFDKKSGYPVRATVNTGGHIYNVSVVKITPGKVLPKSTFRFDSKKYPKSKLIDLR